ARVGLFDKPDDLLGAESALLHVRPLGFTDFIASAGTAQWGQVRWMMCWGIWAPPGNALSSMQARRHVIEHASSHRQAT
ncbi:hypothetical protein ABVE18_22500, partial [Xanthomonas euvesicatoria]